MIASAKLDTELAERVRRVAALTGRPVSNVIRQGLIRVITEAEALGSFTWYQLPAAGPDLLTNAPPRRPKARAGSFFDEPMVPLNRGLTR